MSTTAANLPQVGFEALGKLDLLQVGVAPARALPWFVRRHHRMVRLVEVLCRVLPRRAVANIEANVDDDGENRSGRQRLNVDLTM